MTQRGAEIDHLAEFKAQLNWLYGVRGTDTTCLSMEWAIEEIERLREALGSIEGWSRAYPLKIFPEPDFAKTAELLKAGGITLDAVSASAMRHVIEGVGKIARVALNDGEPR